MVNIQLIDEWHAFYQTTNAVLDEFKRA